MKGIKLGILGISVSLLGSAMSTNHVIAMAGGAVGVVLALAGCFVRDV